MNEACSQPIGGEAAARLIEPLTDLVIRAGEAILAVNRAAMKVDGKPDGSPVTEADLAADTIIGEGLARIAPEIPALSEERVHLARPPYTGSFFLIDPLDGTKEFVKRGNDFTVNIALVRHGAPEVGVVFAPCSGHLYLGRPGRAEVAEVDAGFAVGLRREITVRRAGSPLAVVASRSHRTAETDAYIATLGETEIVSVGSSLKFCLLAQASADVYPRFGRTMEWDTAAGDAVLRAAGGTTQTLDGTPLAYGKRSQPHDADFANPFFIARGR